MNLVIDIGNTLAKVAVFDQGHLLEVRHAEVQDLAVLFREMDVARRCDRGIVCAVARGADEVASLCAESGIELLRFTADTPLPITNGYRTPQTLGLDRMAAAVGAWVAMGGSDVLVVDAGSCITYDYVSAAGRYEGGNIAPGITMRFKAMHEHTARLPLVTPEGELPPLGYDTLTAMRSGVISGVVYEIEGYLRQLQASHADVKLMLTGGDSPLILSRLANGARQDAYLVLRGLDYILNQNRQ